MSQPDPPPASAPHLPRLIAWEVTRSCLLACKHCRAGAQPGPYPQELSTEECFRLLDNLASFARPILILTGGEPMLRPDIYEIASRAHTLGLPVVMASCGALIDDASAARIVQCGIRRISLSLDGATPASHDAFRGVDGAFAAALRGLEAARRAGLDFQINTTVDRHNLDELPQILELAVRLGASVFNPFLLVPVGRGRELASQELTPQEYERTLRWLAGREGRGDIQIRVTCAPHYQRILRQMHVPLGPRPARGCMGGQSFAFLSHRGKVQICGFLDVECGDVRKEDFNFRQIWETSEVFRQMRDPARGRGRCGSCEFAAVCGGCRARAWAVSGDYLGEEPFCTYQPKRTPAPPAEDAEPLQEADRKILSAIQADFPLADRPFDILAQRLGLPASELLERVARLRRRGIIRRLGAVFDSRSLGYASTLVAARVPPPRLAEVAAIVTEQPGVTHNYARGHAYNLWFTLTAESEPRLQQELEGLRRRTGIEPMHSLPAQTVYKIRAVFDAEPAEPGPGAAPSAAAALDEDRKRLVRRLQDDLPLVPDPLGAVAELLGWPAERVIHQMADWIAQGVIRRVGAVVGHRRLGFSANGMAVFAVAGPRVDEVGRQLAQRREVSHCYRRRPLEDFPYNLFAMVHGRDERQVRGLVDRLAREAAVSEYDVLFSTVEYKKTSAKYFLEASME